MSDLIRRQDAINKFESWLEVKGYSEGERNIIKCVLYELENLPSAELWIPCSEELPKKLEDVVVCMADAPEETDIAYLRKTFNKHYKSQGCENEFVSRMGDTTYADYEVVAWMPLPDPWEGDPS